MKHLLLCVALAVTMNAGAARADTPTYTTADVRQYDAIAAKIPVCAAAHALAVKLKNDPSPALAQRYAQCGSALKARHVTPAVLRVNAAMFTTQCTALEIENMGSKKPMTPICGQKM